MVSAFLMLRRLAAALRVALREEDFERVLSAGAAPIVVGTITFTLSNGWSAGRRVLRRRGDVDDFEHSRPEARSQIRG
jgi:hypothetical protein